MEYNIIEGKGGGREGGREGRGKGVGREGNEGEGKGSNGKNGPYNRRLALYQLFNFSLFFKLSITKFV